MSNLFARDWDAEARLAVVEFNKNAKHIEVRILPRWWFSEVAKQIEGDITYAIVSITLIVFYCAIFLGSCSPIHCRLILALTGVFCVIMACASGFGVCLIYGWKMSELSNALPVLMLGIGVDDMFVICNAID